MVKVLSMLGKLSSIAPICKNRIHSLRMISSTVQLNTNLDGISSLLSAQEALSLSSNSKVKFIDGSWYLGDSNKGPSDFISARIPDSQFFDVDKISDTSSPLPHMLPTADKFSDSVSKLGISSDNHVVVYTKAGCASAPRVWWTFKAMGHNSCSILQGGFEAWKEAGGKVQSGDVVLPEPGSFTATLDKKTVVTWKEVLAIVETGSSQIIDARPGDRFLGIAPEPRPIPSGHIPGSLSIPSSEFIQGGDPTVFKSKEDLRDMLLNAGVVFGVNVVSTCGSGVNACYLAFALHLIGKGDKCAIYDGSWTEWVQIPNVPKLP